MRLTRRGDGSLYDQVTAGFKANLSDVLAAIALVQLDRVEAHAAIRERQFALYDEGLAGLDGIAPLERDPRDTHALHLYAVRIDAAAGAGATRDAYQQALTGELIGTSIHFLPVHRLTWFRERYPDQPRLPVAERAGDEVLSLPLSPAHSDDDILDAVDCRPPRACAVHVMRTPHVPRLSHVKRPLRILIGDHAHDPRGRATSCSRSTSTRRGRSSSRPTSGGSGSPSRS